MARELLSEPKEVSMKKHWKICVLSLSIIFTLSIFGPGFAGQVNIEPAAVKSNVEPSKDWTPDQIARFVKQSWTKEELRLMGENEYILDKDQIKSRYTGKDLAPKQLYQNGKNIWLPIMWQYGIGMNMKEFKKIWIDQGKWKDPDHVLLDIRMESEYLQGHIPGAVRLDTGLDYWHLPGIAPKCNATYYLQCKSGTPADGGIRGAFVKKHMIDMGYTGEIYNLTDGFRGWLELGYPVINRHGQFALVPGTFQKADPYYEKKGGELKYSPHP